MYRTFKPRKNASQKIKKNTPAEHKRVVLNFVQREEIIQKRDQGYSVHKLSQEYNVSVSTIYKILNIGIERLKEYRKENPYSKIRKNFKASTYDSLDKALKIWVYQERAKRNYISTNQLKNKAVEFHKELYPNATKQFLASNGFLQKFCSRHSIKLRNVHGEQLSADNQAADDFIKVDLPSILEEYSLEQIYNADECGLNYNGVPQNTLTTPYEASAKGHKISKNRVTLLTCANATGKHKLPLAFVHKSANPRCFGKKFKKATLPVFYDHSSNAWITQDIFSKWFNNEFVPKLKTYLQSISLEPKAVLLIDNCPAHPEKLQSSDGQIKCVFLPANTTSLIQPMDQGVIANLKRQYRAKMINSIVYNNDSTQTFLKKYNIKEVIYSVAKIWNEINENTLKSSWHKLGLNLQVSVQLAAIDNIELRRNLAHMGLELSDIELENWMSNHDNDPGYGLLSDQEIISSVLNEDHFDSEEDSDEESNQDDSILVESSSQNNAVQSSTRTLKCFDEIMEYLTIHKETLPEEYFLAIFLNSKVSFGF